MKDFECSIEWRELKERNWNKAWEASFHAVEISDFCRIRADFHESKQQFKHEILINPEMAFGTGHHETTYLMIKSMESIDFRNKRVLDFGSGTGILAILASKLGAKEIDAVDNDEKAVRNTKANCLLNKADNVNAKLSIKGTINRNDYNIILANINKYVLKNYIQRISELAASNAILLMSGLLLSDENEMIAHYTKNGFTLISKMHRGEWISLVFNKSY